MDSASTPLGASGIARIRDVILNADHVAVRARCEVCGSIAELDWPALALSHSEEKPLRTLARRIRCKVCGARGCGWLMTDGRSPSAGPPSGAQRWWTAG